MPQPNDLSRSLVALDQDSTVIVTHPSSVAVSRQHRRAKTDRLDTELLKRGFLGWLRGERGHCSMARVPTIAEEVYEQGRIRHMGAFTALEDQMCEFTPDLDRSKPKRDSTDPSSLGKGGRTSPDRADALVWAFTELLVEEISSWGIYETTRRKAEALVKERLAAVEAGRPKTEYAPGSMEYQALHPDWKPQEESY